ncbi:MAG: DNA mismatch repair protein MutS [Tannerella sp.]|jgi:ABC-type Na+ transport system ATPase subunit NatA|nr:DNA mismatch repair protein MutS [Tannerella sp.]
MFFKKRIKKNNGLSDPWNKVKDELYEFDSVGSYFRNKKHDSAFQVINDKTVNDIDLHEIFMFIDRTNSRTGQQYLFNKLLTINLPHSYDAQERLIDYFNQNEEMRNKARHILSKLNKHEAYYIPDLFLSEYIKKPKWFRIIPVISALSITTLILTFFLPKMLFLLLPLLVISIILHYWNKRNIFVYIDSIPQLLILCEAAKELEKSDIPDISGKTSVQASLKSINSLKKRLSVFKLEAKSNGSELAALVLLVVEYIKILFLLEPQVVFNVLGKLEKKKNDIQTLFEYIGNIDTAISIASLRATVSFWCNPVFTDKLKALKVKDVYHPLIINAVSNTLDTDGKSILLTGSNMSGKTTFIRTIAINILLAQTINTAFAKEFHLSPRRIFSAIRISDDLLNDKSYYMAEVETIKAMVDESHSDYPNIFFLDEIFKGTNTIERIAAGKAVLSHLSTGNNLVFVSTHDIEIANLLADSYNLFHFTETVDDKNIHFDYKLKPGKLTTKNAIRILELNNYPIQIISEARKISDSLKSFS